MKINFEKLEQLTGIKDINKEDLIFYIKSILYNLKINNKNYNKEQFERIMLLNDIFESIE